MTPQAVEADSVKVEIFPSQDYTDLLLRITRDNIIIQESSVNPVVFYDEDRFPDGRYPPIFGTGIAMVRDLDLDGEPEIVLDTTTHGANCCTLIVVLYFDLANQQYNRTFPITTSWRFSPRLIDIDQGGKPEFLTRNEAFNYLVGGDGYTSVVSPLQILRYENRVIVDVTYQYPQLVEDDAALWWEAVQGEEAELSEQYKELTLEDPEFWVTGVRGIEFFALKSYLADMITLGRGNEGCQNVQAFFERDRERWSAVFEEYGDNICPNFIAEIEAAIEGRMVEN